MTSDRSDETEVEGKDETDTRTESDTGETDKPYIRDERYRAKIDGPEDEVEIVKRHYRSAYLDERKPVWPHIARLGGIDAKDDDDAPITQVLAGNSNWYAWSALAPEDRGDGWTSIGRVVSWTLDGLRMRIDNLSEGPRRDWRTIYHTTSWKDPTALDNPIRYNSNSGNKSDRWDIDEDNPLPNYDDIRGLSMWIDGDLADEWKDRRGELTDEQIETVEAVWEGIIDEFARAYELTPEDIAAFDSGGGMYAFGPAAATVPIAEHYDQDDRKTIFDELADRLNDYAEDAYDRVVERVGGDAAELTGPDYPNNKNRQTKAPLSIHKKHDVLVTPLRDENGEIDYTPTLISDAHDADSEPSWPGLINRTIEECKRLTSTDERILESVDPLVKNLWADEIDEDEAYADVETWTNVLDTWLEERRKEQDRREQSGSVFDGDGDESSSVTADDSDMSWVGVEEARDALTHIDEDLGRDDWIRVILALGHHFDEDTAKELATEWSKRGTKWDTESKDQIDDLVGRAQTNTPNNPITIKTVIKLALSDGWTLPDHHDGPIPDSDGSSTPFAALKQQISADEHAAARLRERGEETWPTTEEARSRLRKTVLQSVDRGKQVVIPAPTSLGKSYAISATPWRDVTEADGAPVVHLSGTCDARDEQVAETRDAGGTAAKLLGRDEACPCAAGEFDPIEDDRNADRPEITVDGQPISEWIKWVCSERGRGIPFSVAHSWAAENNDQGVTLPCLKTDGPGSDDDGSEGSECRAINQWRGVPWTDDGEPAADVIHGTHPMAHVPSLRLGTVVAIDEPPDYSVDMDNSRIREAVVAWLRWADAPVTTWEAFVEAAHTARKRRQNKNLPDEPDDVSELWGLISNSEDPGREWYLKTDGAHTLAPALARVIWWALSDPEGADVNGRYSSITGHKPPRLDAGAHDEEKWNQEWLSVVIDEENSIRTLRCSPDFGPSKALIGLDANAETDIRKWKANASPFVEVTPIMTEEERRGWRRFERGLTVVQVGDARRPAGRNGRYYDQRGDRVFLDHLRREFGDEFSTTIGPKAAEDELREAMTDVGIDEPRTITYGMEKSSNEFTGESIGFVSHTIDPGDEWVLDRVAETSVRKDQSNKDARPEYYVQDVECPECGETSAAERFTNTLKFFSEQCDRCRCHECNGTGCSGCSWTGFERTRGRGFAGKDAEVAEEILAEVSRIHPAQAAGRYARNPGDPDDSAIVFVRTDAIPDDMVDFKIGDVTRRYGDKFPAVDNAIQTAFEENDGEPVTTPDMKEWIRERVDVSDRWIEKTLENRKKQGLLDHEPSRGPYPAKWKPVGRARAHSHFGELDGSVEKCQQIVRTTPLDTIEGDTSNNSLTSSAVVVSPEKKADGGDQAVDRAETDGGRTLDIEATATINTSASAVDNDETDDGDEEPSQIDRIEEMGRLLSDALDGDSVNLGDLRGD